MARRVGKPVIVASGGGGGIGGQTSDFQSINANVDIGGILNFVDLLKRPKAAREAREGIVEAGALTEKEASKLSDKKAIEFSLEILSKKAGISLETQQKELELGKLQEATAVLTGQETPTFLKSIAGGKATQSQKGVAELALQKNPQLLDELTRQSSDAATALAQQGLVTPGALSQFIGGKFLKPESTALRSTVGKRIQDRNQLAQDFGEESSEVKNFDAQILQEQLGKQFSVELDRNGNLVIRKGGITGQQTQTQTTNLQKSVTSGISTLGLINQIKEIATPENLGLIGDVTRTVQGAIEQGGAIAEFFKGTRGSIDFKENEIIKNVLNKDILDPNLSAIDFLETALTFQAAKTLQQGDRLSDVDVKLARKSLGFDRKLTGIKQVTQRLDAFEKFIKREVKNSRKSLGQTFDIETRVGEIQVENPGIDVNDAIDQALDEGF